MKRVVGGVLLLGQALAVPVDAVAASLSSLLSALDLGGYARDERPPDFLGLTTHGFPLTLAELHGKVVLLASGRRGARPAGRSWKCSSHSTGSLEPSALRSSP